MENENYPLVSIGVPVYNGEKSLACALDSLIEQDYPNLEIIISDNASTDATLEICQEYARKNFKVRYSRLKENLGLVWNHNRTFELSSGKYFMWASHDDTRDRSFVRACVEKMEQCPGAVLCHPHAAVYSGQGGPLVCSSNLDNFESIKGLVDRYETTLKYASSLLLHGLFLSSAMRKTQVMQKVLGGDMSFIRELSIYGDFVQVQRVLFSYVMRDKWNTVNQDYFTLLGKEKKPWWYLPFLVLFWNQWKQLAYFPIPLSMKFRLSGVLIRHEAKQVALKILIKVAKGLCPDRWKEKLGCAIYWRWMHLPGIQVVCADLYLERIIKPRLGWWS